MKILNKNIIKLLNSKKGIKINMGVGSSTKQGYFSLDHLPMDNVDILADLNKPLNLLPDNSVDAIYSSHVLEHIENLDDLLREIYRITKSNGEIEIIVPHFSNPYYYSDPTHRRFFGLYTMYYYVDTCDQPQTRKVPAFYSDIRFNIKSIKYDFFERDFIDKILCPLLTKLVNISIGTQDFYERHLSGIISARQINYIISPVKN